MVFDWEGNIVECFCQDEQRRKIVNIDLFHLTKISGTSRGLESLSEGLLNFTEAGKEWEVVAEAESLLVVSAVVEWKPDLGSYLKVYLGARKSWVWMGARQPFLVHSTRKWVNVCVFQSWCWADVSVTSLKSNVRLTAWCCQSSHGPGVLKQPGATSWHWDWELWFGSAPLGLP